MLSCGGARTYSGNIRSVVNSRETYCFWLEGTEGYPIFHHFNAIYHFSLCCFDCRSSLTFLLSS